jgi:hypothetical protein
MKGSALRAKGLLVAFAISLANMAASAETIDRVLAVVAGQLITLSDVNAARDLGIITASANSPDPTKEVLAKVIDRELMLAEVERYAPPEPDTADIDREVAKVRARFPSAKAFDDVLARSGFDLNHVREMVRQNLRLQAYLDQRFAVANTDQQRRQTMIDDWLVSLRRRTPAVNLYNK